MVHFRWFSTLYHSYSPLQKVCRLSSLLLCLPSSFSFSALSSPPTFLSNPSLNLKSPQCFSTSPPAAMTVPPSFPPFVTPHPICLFSPPSLLHLLSHLFHPSFSSCQLQFHSAYFHLPIPTVSFCMSPPLPSLPSPDISLSFPTFSPYSSFLSFFLSVLHPGHE